MSKMSVAYRVVLRKELPWLPVLLPESVDTFFASLIDLDTLGIKPGYEHTDAVILISDDGKIIGKVGVPEIPTGAGIFFRFSMLFLRQLYYVVEGLKLTGEDLEKAIKRLPDSHKTRYILQLRFHQTFATLHKLPRSVENINVWLDQKTEEARIDLRKSLSGYTDF